MATTLSRTALRDSAAPFKPSRRTLILVSPLVVLSVGTLVGNVALPILGAWTWLPVMLTYWILLGG